MPGALLQELVDADPTVDGQSGPLGQRNPRSHPHTGDDQIGLQPGVIGQRDERTLQVLDGRAEVEHHAMRFMEPAHELSELRSEHALHRHRLRRHHVHLDAAAHQRGGNLQSDEAGTDHQRALAGRCGRCDGAAVVKAAQRAHLACSGTRHGQRDRLRAGGQQQRVEAMHPTVGQQDLASGGIDRAHGRVQQQLDMLLGKPTLWSQ